MMWNVRIRNEKSKVIQVICLNLLYGLFQVKKSETIKSQEAEPERKCWYLSIFFCSLLDFVLDLEEGGEQKYGKFSQIGNGFE